MQADKRYFAVTGSKAPYVYDLPHLLSLPPGFEFRFRYRHEWVDRGLWNDLRHRRDIFAGKELIILFHSPETGRLLPIRQCTILSAEELGPVVYLRLQLGKFAATSFDVRTLATAAEPDRSEQSKSQTATARLLTGLDTANLSLRLPDGFYFREIAVDPPISWSEDHITGWGGFATLLQDEPNVKGVPFFYLLGFQQQDRTAVKLTEIVGNQRGFELIVGRRYRLRLLMWSWSYPESAQVRVTCGFEEGVLHQEGAADLAHSRYDVLEYSFRAAHRGYTEVRLATEPLREKKGEQQVAWESWPAIYLARIPVRVRNSWPNVLGLAAAAITGFLLYLLTPIVLPAEARSAIAIFQAIGLMIAFTVSSGVADMVMKTREHVMTLTERPRNDTP